MRASKITGLSFGSDPADQIRGSLFTAFVLLCSAGVGYVFSLFMPLSSTYGISSVSETLEPHIATASTAQKDPALVISSIPPAASSPVLPEKFHAAESSTLASKVPASKREHMLHQMESPRSRLRGASRTRGTLRAAEVEFAPNPRPNQATLDFMGRPSKN
jgi:hypothetical protein